MSKINFLRPEKENLNTFLYLGSLLFFISVLDVFLNSFFNVNITSFLPTLLSFVIPLVIGFIGLHFIRIEHSGYKFLDSLNKNINTNSFNAVLSLLIIFVTIKATPPILSWFFVDASFAGDSKDVCSGTGACWTYIKVWFNRFMYGMYPNAEQWRINLSFISLALLGSVGYFATEKFKKYLTLYYVVIYPFIAFLFIFFFISGGPIFFDFSYGIIAAVISIILGFFIPSRFKFYYFLIVPLTIYIVLKHFVFYEELIELGKLDGLNWVETGAWGGLSLTFIISFFCLIFCFPIGMAFALGRRSELPLIRYISVGFIEFWRGVPLITVLFMSAVMFPMFLPEDFFIDKLVRAIIAISLFEAAYVAEVIRGGLQALPRGQYEAAKSLGMGYWKMHIFVILPQALKLVIPGIANTFLALVKDTPLIFVVGLLEIVGMLNLAKTNPEWLGFAMEGYVFAAIIFWIICYAMSKYSYNLEQKYKTER
ncbi:amino acid ABC transporter permease [Candidatus Pelagibacter sp. HIMB1542]|uniref:amino acid ABC transporter permease n=1 Tax=Candidatus Pelagibacter sp. HIMB1542 TaxID=3413346 RepID=UPI003F82A719